MEFLRRTLASFLFVMAMPALSWGQGFDVIFEDGFDGCPGAAKYVYFFDEQARLHRFDPRRLGTASNPFELIGTPTCAVGAPLPGWPGGVIPYSLSVARDGQLWALFTSGEIFRIDPVSLACNNTGFAYTDDWQLFAVAFAGRSGGVVEPLSIAGGEVDPAQMGNLGRIDPASLQATTVGPLGAPASAEYTPWLTGVGESELFGFYPSSTTHVVQQIDLATGGLIEPARTVPAADNEVAWAFAHWGGYFWLFLTDADIFTGEQTARLVQVNRTTGAVAQVLSNIPFVAVTGRLGLRANLHPVALHRRLVVLAQPLAKARFVPKVSFSRPEVVALFVRHASLTGSPLTVAGQSRR